MYPQKLPNHSGEFGRERANTLRDHFLTILIVPILMILTIAQPVVHSKFAPNSSDIPMLLHSRRLAAFLLALACPAVLEADDLNSLQGRLEQIEADNQQLREELADLQARESLLATPVLSVQEHTVAAPAAPAAPAPATDDPKAFSANGFFADSGGVHWSVESQRRRQRCHGACIC